MPRDRTPALDPCPQCGFSLLEAICWDEMRRQPEKEDLTVCTQCAAPLIFVSARTTRVLTNADLCTLDSNDQQLVAKSQVAVARMAVKH